jgi:hypothetical protein
MSELVELVDDTLGGIVQGEGPLAAVVVLVGAPDPGLSCRLGHHQRA